MTKAKDSITKQEGQSKAIHGEMVVAVCAEPAGDEELLKAAARLAVDLNLVFLEKPVARSGEIDALLVVTGKRLELRFIRGPERLKEGKGVWAELEAIDTTSGAGRSLQQPLVKAMGIKKYKDLPITVLDATGGWGEDAWLLASLGCRVLTVERNKVVGTLLRDGIWRAGATRPEVLARLQVLQADARHVLRRIARRGEETGEQLPGHLQEFLEPQVVYLDPMFADHGKRKTAERKPLGALRAMVGDDADAGELLYWGLKVARRRVVVKQPAKATALGQILAEPVKPTVSFEGRSVRYDVYVVKVDQASGGIR